MLEYDVSGEIDGFCELLCREFAATRAGLPWRSRTRADQGEVRAAAGVFAEPLPGCPDEIIDRLQAKSEEIAQFSERLDAGETPQELLESAFGEFGLVYASESGSRSIAVIARVSGLSAR